ncbi:MAG: hypothetical protein MI919_15905 [Holophagales bacterium]|nr:hypothetical protein [Holophagales bacterium]
MSEPSDLPRAAGVLRASEAPDSSDRHRASVLRPRGSSRRLFPLTELLGVQVPEVERIFDGDADDMPDPYRRLLVHPRDMTSTLERFHGEPPCLDPIRRQRRSSSLWREVLLRGERTGRVMEYGAIRIELGAFDADARWQVLEGRKPLGAILAEYRLTYESRPRRYFALWSNPRLEEHLGLPGRTLLYGRQNVLEGETGTIADVVEILPPTGPRR